MTVPTREKSAGIRQAAAPLHSHRSILRLPRPTSRIPRLENVFRNGERFCYFFTNIIRIVEVSIERHQRYLNKFALRKYTVVPD